ncbi:hypothetical protein FSP39_011827 [Pinctada imbricata]|uniref:Uncharacterized protein n=1 Tax=Pinctada imbricata TaxID=66713 RepID=A0AA89C4G6_PINIB|nr:hypothetical protein FSP39_011827 [Pinctada imbricata]
MSASHRFDLPSEASLWRNNHLKNLEMFYNERCIPITEMIGSLNSLYVRESRSVPNIPEIMSKIMDIIRNIWSYSVDEADLKLSTKHTLEQIDRMKQEFPHKCAEFVQQNADLVEEDYNSIFSDWCSRMKMFLNWSSLCIKRLRDQEVTEGLYTQLFMQFSLICLLQPEIGECYKEQMRIKGVLVSSIPSIRFPKFSDDLTTEFNRTVAVVTIAEIEDISYMRERYHMQNSEAFNVHNILPNELLGQHGAELLIETKKSCFRPKVCGMICVGSKVIFTHLDMTSEHLKAIKGKEEWNDSFRCIIAYSRPYNFMNACDRREMLEMLFWLGYLQSPEFVLMK